MIHLLHYQSFRCCLWCAGWVSRAPGTPGPPERRSRRPARRAALDRGGQPEPPGKGAPHWGTRERNVLDVRDDVATDLTGARDGVGGGAMQASPVPPAGPQPAGPQAAGAGRPPRRGSEWKNPHHKDLGRAPCTACRSGEARLGSGTSAGALGFLKISTFPPRRRENILGHRNVGLDYTARPANCQSANTFVAARQSRAPRLANPPVCTVPPPPPPSTPIAPRTASASARAEVSPAAIA